MKKHPLLFIFIILTGILLVSWAGINIFVDPYGVFESDVCSWYSYSMTLNPRIGKIKYIQNHFDEYDSYIIGASNAAAYTTETLNEIYDASFYNMFHYGFSCQYDYELIEWLLQNDSDVKNILLSLSPNDANASGYDDYDVKNWLPREISGCNSLQYYLSYAFSQPSTAIQKISASKEDTLLPQSFDVFLEQSGCYDKSKRDVEMIGDLESYQSSYENNFFDCTCYHLAYLDNFSYWLQKTVDLCEEHGVNLLVILSPGSRYQLKKYTEAEFTSLRTTIAEITDFWDFSASSISMDDRYFYDSLHFRNCVGEMIYARIFENSDIWFPEDFGVQYINGVPQSEVTSRSDYAVSTRSASIPVLLYHNIEDCHSPDDNTLPTETFSHQMDLLEENGFVPVTLEDLIHYVYWGEDLPENAVLITFDDGYTSVYTNAFPVLEEHRFPFTVFVIGSSFGKSTYKNTGNEIFPHFGYEEASDMLSSGLVSLQSHTFDMHQSAELEEGIARETILPFADETESSYMEVLLSDSTQERELLSFTGEDLYAIAFPYGSTSTLTDVSLSQDGYQISFTTDSSQINTIVKGIPQSLLKLGRLSVTPSVTDEELLNYLTAD